MCSLNEQVRRLAFGREIPDSHPSVNTDNFDRGVFFFVVLLHLQNAIITLTCMHTIQAHTLKKAVACSSKTSLKFYQTTRLYISEYGNLHDHHSENIKSHNVISI